MRLESVTGVSRIARRFVRNFAQVRSRRIQGAIDFADLRIISGWVRYPGSDEPVTFDVLIDGKMVASKVIADLYRSDLEAAGLGKGRHGFNVTLDLTEIGASIASVPELRVYIRDSLSGAVLLSRLLVTQLPALTVVTEDRHDEETLAVQLPLVAAGEVSVSEYRVRIDKLSREGRLQGWSLNLDAPKKMFMLEVLIDGVHYTWVKNDRSRQDLLRHFPTDGKGGFDLQVPFRYLEAGMHAVTVIAPDGTKVTSSISTQGDHKPAELDTNTLSVEGIAIVVPIYNAADDVEVCIRRLLEYTDTSVEVILINDCSTDPRIAPILDRASEFSHFRVLHNNENLGFTRTVNRGLVESGMRDVIILNSDARVTPRWLPSMLAAARALPRVATVTPMSDRAGSFSAPEIGNENDLPPGIDEAAYARAFRRRQRGTYPVVPTGNGFCMLITRAAIQEIGLFDDDGFPRGYGEENDFCMRAMRAGWHNLIDDRTYVFHDRTKSFGASKQVHAEAGARVVNDRYPEYRLMTRVFREGDEIRLARFLARQALSDCTRLESILPRALFVISTSSGGTPQTNLDLMYAVSDSYDCWLLRCDSRIIELSHLVGGEVKPVASHRLRHPIDPLTHRSLEYDRVVESWLVFYDFELVHIRHLAWHSLSLPALAKANHIAVIHSFHDFYALCPTLNLRKDEDFCSGACSRMQGSCDPALWAPDSMPDVNRQWVEVWRSRYQKAIVHCDAFVTTSEPVRERILTYLPDIARDRFHVIPHGRDFLRFDAMQAPTQAGEPLRIIIPGNVNLNKGLGVINALLEHDTENLLEFHLLGTCSTEPSPHPRIVLHGPYTRGDFSDRARAIYPHIGAVFTIVEETWCHTLTELWSIGLPAVVFDFPTVAGRVRESGAGWIVDHRDISSLYNSLIKIMTDRDELSRVHLAVRKWQSTVGAARTSRFMGAQYLDVYRLALAVSRHSIQPQRSRPCIAVVQPDRSSNLDWVSISNYNLLSERTRNSPDRPFSFVRMHPEAVLANLATGGIYGAIIQRNAMPGPWVDRAVEAFLAAKVPYIVELDDDLFEVPDDYNSFGVYAAYRPRLEVLIQKASGLLVSSSVLRDRMAQLNNRVDLVPSALPLAAWALENSSRVPEAIVRALYVGLTSDQADLDMILPALKVVATERPNFRLTVIDGNDSVLPSFAERMSLPLDVHQYSQVARWFVDQRSKFDFTLAPLQETRFNEAKSDLKILQSGALGLSVVASRHPAFAHFTKRSGVTLVRNRTKDWTAAVIDQIDHRDRHEKAGRELRNWVFKYRAIETSTGEFDRLLEKLLAV